MADMGASVGNKDFGENTTPGTDFGNQEQVGGIDTSEGVDGLTTGAPELTPAQFNALTPEQKAQLEGVPFERNIFGNPDFKSQTLAINNFISRYQREKGPLGEAEFNTLKGITATNPFGVDGRMTRTLGFDPTKVDYRDILGGGREGTVFNKKNALGEYVVKSGNAMQGIPAAQYNRMYGTPAQQTAANQYSKYVNPENIPGAPGFNPMYPSGTQGTLRSGAEKAGLLTQFGPVMGQYREMSPTELGMRALIGLTPLSFASALDTQEYGIPGREGYESFNPANPRGAQSMLGNAFEKFKEGIGSMFNPTPSSTGVGIDSGLIPSTNPLSGETSAAPLPQSLISRSPMQQEIPGEFVRDPAILDALMGGASRPAQQPISAGGGQMSFLGGENPRAAGMQELQDMIRALTGGENFPDDQNMYGPGMPDLQRSYDLNDLDQLGAQGIGSFNVAADVTNMRDVGGGMYQSEYGKSTVDKILEGLGFGGRRSGPSGQIYAPGGNKSNMFQDIVSYFS
jgi:hypothetical protein